MSDEQDGLTLCEPTICASCESTFANFTGCCWKCINDAKADDT